MTTFWGLYAGVLLSGALVYVVAVLFLPGFRRRQRSGGRSVPFTLSWCVLFGAAALVNAVADKSGHPVVGSAAFIVMLPIFLVMSNRYRRSLDQIPDEDLLPSLARWRAATPEALDMLRHPLRSMRLVGPVLREAFDPALRKRDREWQSSRGLR